MCFLITLFAAIVSTIVWYAHAENDKLNVKMLTYLFWGASIMWFVDAVFEYAEMGAKYFTPALEDMINDAYLGLSVIALAMVIWIVALVIKDPKGVIFKKNK
jgi:hypothetical protein